MVHFLGSSSTGPPGPVGATGPVADLGVIEGKLQNQTASSGVTTFTNTVEVGSITSTDDVDIRMKVDDAEWTQRIDYSESGRPFKLARTGYGDVVTAMANGDVVCGGILTCQGLTVNGTTTTVDSTTLEIADATIHTAHNNNADIIDSAYYMEYHDGVNPLYAGLVRDVSISGKPFVLFKDSTAQPLAGVTYSSPADLQVGGLNVTGDIVVTGLVDGVDVATHAANTGIHYVQGSITALGTVTQGILGAGFGPINTTGITSSGDISITGTISTLRLPNMTTTNRLSLTPLSGMCLYNTTDNEIQYYNDTMWRSISSVSAPSTTAVSTPSNVTGYSSNPAWLVDVSSTFGAEYEGWRLFNAATNDFWWASDNSYVGPPDYSATVGGASFNGVEGEYIRVALDKGYVLSSVRFTTSTANAGFPMDWHILYSTDNTTWSTAYTSTGGVFTEDTGTLSFYPVFARYIVFQCTRVVTSGFAARYVRFTNLYYA
jgi:hypothetical protein